MNAYDSQSATSDFYHLYDLKKIAEIEWSNHFSLAIAVEAQEKENHRKAISVLWNEALRTYRQGCWIAHEEAMGRLGREWLQIGEIADAVYCAILAMDDRLARSIGDNLFVRGDAILIGSIVDKVLSTANLREHFCVACEFLDRIGDAIPDNRLEAVAEWLIRRGSIPEEDRGTSGPLYRSWKALQPIAHRLTAELARRAVLTAVSHPIWTGARPLTRFDWVARQQMVLTVNHLVAAILAGELELLAHQALPLAQDRWQPTDYNDVIELLCHIAERGGEGVRQWIGERLYEPGRPRYHVLGQVDHVFGQQYLPDDRLHLLAKQVAGQVRLQVQRRPHGQPFEEVPGTDMYEERKAGPETIRISMGTMMGWHAVARHRRQVPLDSIREMALAAVEMLKHPENSTTNLLMLVSGIVELADILDGATTEVIAAVLERVARGEITGAPERPHHPLDAVKITTTTLADLQRSALVGLARVGARNPELYRQRLDALLEVAFCDPHVEIRRGAFAAFRDFPGQTDGSLLALLLGTRDPDPGGAIAAFAALAEKKDLDLNRNHWRQLLYSIRLASQSTSSNLRLHAAAALSHLIGQAPKGAIRSQAQEILARFRTDVSANIRNAVRITSE